MKSLLWLIGSMQTENLKRAFSDAKAMRFIVIFYVFICHLQRDSLSFSMCLLVIFNALLSTKHS